MKVPNEREAGAQFDRDVQRCMLAANAEGGGIVVIARASGRVATIVGSGDAIETWKDVIELAASSVAAIRHATLRTIRLLELDHHKEAIAMEGLDRLAEQYFAEADVGELDMGSYAPAPAANKPGTEAKS